MGAAAGGVRNEKAKCAVSAVALAVPGALASRLAVEEQQWAMFPGSQPICEKGIMKNSSPRKFSEIPKVLQEEFKKLGIKRYPYFDAIFKIPALHIDI